MFVWKYCPWVKQPKLIILTSPQMWKVQFSSSTSMEMIPGSRLACWMLAPCAPIARPMRWSGNVSMSTTPICFLAVCNEWDKSKILTLKTFHAGWAILTLMRNFQTEQPSPLCVHYSTSAEKWSRCYRMRYTTFHLFRGCCNLFGHWFCCLSCEFTVNNKSPIWDYIHPDDQTQPTFGHFQVTETHIFKTRLYSCENEF